MQTRIHYVSAPAGSGKTFGLERLAAKLVASENRKILIAQPTWRLIDQTVRQIAKINPDIAIRKIYSKDDRRPVATRIEAHMANADKGKGQVLLISHEALKRLPSAYRHHWDLFVDEIPSVFECLGQLYEITAKPVDQKRLEDCVESLRAMDLGGKIVTFICRLPQDVATLAVADNTLLHQGAMFQFIDINDFIRQSFCILSPDRQSEVIGAVDKFVKDTNRKVEVKNGWGAAFG